MKGWLPYLGAEMQKCATNKNEAPMKLKGASNHGTF
jgi:hypothetical protein